MDLALCSDTPQGLENMEEFVRKKADNNIKIFIENIFKARERLVGAKG